MKQNHQHLAIFREPYLSAVLDGRKTVESRFSKNKCAPFGRVKEGDIILLKRSGGMIVAWAKAGCVWSYDAGLSRLPIKEIRQRFGKRLCIDDVAFWKAKAAARYATLIELCDVTRLDPTPFPKRDRRGWVVIK